MDLTVEFPIECVVISIFIGYMYYYMVDADYQDIFSLTSVKIGCISGFTLSTIAVLYGLISANVFTLSDFIESSVCIGIQAMFVGIVLVVIGGLFAVTVKRILSKFKRE